MRILTLIYHYLPGYRGGGPIRSLAAMIECLGDEIEYDVVTSDRDLKDTKPYPNIAVSRWQTVGRAKVYYCSPGEYGQRLLKRMIDDRGHDIIYTNGFFSEYTRKALLWNRVGALRGLPFVVAPRGEFSEGALSLKSVKKNAYIKMIQVLGLPQGIMWHATCEKEKAEITQIFREDSRRSRIVVAPNLPSWAAACDDEIEPARKEPGRARIVFLSRISRMKNLDYALRILSRVQGEVDFDIWGPIEDHDYWKECVLRAEGLPVNVRWAYRGEARPEEVLRLFTQYHLFLFPTRGENFGHVILESLSAGCPVATSNQTPWKDLSPRGAGWAVKLEDEEQFRRIVEEVISMGQSDFLAISRSARKMAGEYRKDPAPIMEMRELFHSALMMRGTTQGSK